MTTKTETKKEQPPFVWVADHFDKTKKPSRKYHTAYTHFNHDNDVGKSVARISPVYRSHFSTATQKNKWCIKTATRYCQEWHFFPFVGNLRECKKEVMRIYQNPANEAEKIASAELNHVMKNGTMRWLHSDWDKIKGNREIIKKHKAALKTVKEYSDALVREYERKEYEPSGDCVPCAGDITEPEQLYGVQAIPQGKAKAKAERKWVHSMGRGKAKDSWTVIIPAYSSKKAAAAVAKRMSRNGDQYGRKYTVAVMDEETAAQSTCVPCAGVQQGALPCK